MKTRLDVLLTERGLSPSREKAQSTIMAGLVFVDGQMCDKAGTKFDSSVPIEVRGNDCPYVSRGGFKLEKALDVFSVSVEGLHCADIGASSGGFTDCMLQRGAQKVYAIDVGTNQLDWKLRSDPRVVSMEKLNFRYMSPDQIPEKLDFACTDVSFISLKHILPPAAAILKPGALMVCLIKPQFEAGREQVGKNGIVKDPAVHAQVIENVIGYALDSGFTIKDLSYSPIKGAKKGNIEYLICLSRSQNGYTDSSALNIPEVVASAHSGFESGAENEE